jgi:hypothetical protein
MQRRLTQMLQELDFSLVNSYYHISPDGAENPLAEMPATDFFKWIW